jgi:hypothetical protein
MTSITVHPHDGAASFVAWSDGTPHLTAKEMDRAVPLVGLRLGLTPEGPLYVAGWDSIEAATVLLRDLFHRDAVVPDPPLDVSRPEGVV